MPISLVDDHLMSNKTFKAFMAIVTNVAGHRDQDGSRRLRCAFMVTPTRNAAVLFRGM